MRKRAAMLSVDDAIKLIRTASTVKIRAAEAEAVVALLIAMTRRITAMELDLRAVTGEIETMLREKEMVMLVPVEDGE